MGCGRPFRRGGPHDWQAKTPPSSGTVAALVTTVWGAAIPCRRVGPIGGSPRAHRLGVAPPPPPPTTTRPRLVPPTTNGRTPRPLGHAGGGAGPATSHPPP